MPIKLVSPGGGSVTIDVPSTANTVTLTAPARTANLITSADTGTVSQAMLGSNVVGKGPAFGAYNSTNQSFSSGVSTKITYNVEDFDTNSNYDTGNYRFTPTVAGYYQVNAVLNVINGVNNSFLLIQIHKNGSGLIYNVSHQSGTSGAGAAISDIVYMNGTTDYIEVFLFTGYNCNAGGGSNSTRFSAALVRAA